MKIMNCAPEADKPGHYGYHNIRHAFIRCGFEVIDFDVRAEEKQYGRPAMNRRLKERLAAERPAIFYHAPMDDELDPELLNYIKNKTETIALVFFGDDDWRLAHSLERAGYYNFAVTTVKAALPAYAQRGHTHVLLCQWGCNPDLYHPLDVQKIYDVTFIGHAYADRPEVVKFLKASGVDIRVWGVAWEASEELRPIAGRFLQIPEMIEVFSQSKIVLGMPWIAQGLRTQLKGRPFEYAASRAFQLTHYEESLADCFAEDQEIVFYRSPQDLLDKINYFLRHDREREQIAQRAWERTRREHSWAQRWPPIFQAIAARRPAGKKSLPTGS